MRFEWDAAKNKANLKKHGLSFEDAELVFSGPIVTVEDDRRHYGEQLFSALGTLALRVIYVAYTIRGESIRIISMRKANEREKRIYQERFEKN